jgi:hypothetical protein
LTADLFTGPVEDLINAIVGDIQEIVMQLAIGCSRNQPTAEAAEAYTKEYYNKTKFYVLGQLLHPLYVGKNLGMQLLDQRIQSLKMTQHTKVLNDNHFPSFLPSLLAQLSIFSSDQRKKHEWPA